MVKSNHCVVEDNSDAIVEERLAKDEEVESHVDANFLENGEHGNLSCVPSEMELNILNV